MKLAEGRNIVEAGIGTRIGNHDQTGANENSAAIGHGSKEFLIIRRSIYSGGEGHRAICTSGLHLLPGLIDVYRDFQSFAAPSGACSTDRRRAEIVEPDCHPHISFGRADPVRWSETNPSKAFYTRLHRRTTGIRGSHAAGTAKVSSNIPLRGPESAR